MANGHGGARPGAGRKPGGQTLAGQYRDYAKSIGIDPIEYMLSVVADEDNTVQLRLDAARSAAPYMIPKLKYLEVQQNNTFDGDPASLTNEYLAAIIGGAGRRASTREAQSKARAN